MPGQLKHGISKVGSDVRPLYRTLEPWIAFAFIGGAIALQALIPSRIAKELTTELPILEGALLVALIVIRVLFLRGYVHRNVARTISLVLIGVMAMGTAWSLFIVIDRLLAGNVHNGRDLIFAGVKLWGMLVIVSALLYWELDRGGPWARNLEEGRHKHFQFPQDESPSVMGRDWAPTFFDYFYLAVTNATAFSPTDTMPLTHTAKAIMALQSVLSLTTIGLVAARAVNIL